MIVSAGSSRSDNYDSFGRAEVIIILMQQLRSVILQRDVATMMISLSRQSNDYFSAVATKDQWFLWVEGSVGEHGEFTVWLQ